MLAGGLFPDIVTRPFRPRTVLRTCLYYSKLHEPLPLVADFIGCLTRAAKTVAAKVR